MRLFAIALTLLAGIPALSSTVYAQTHSVARVWNEALLQSIREDFARPTVHARNLFHTSIAMWDAWAAYDTQSRPYLLGGTVSGFECGFTGIPATTDVQTDREEAISFAAFRLLSHRFGHSPGAEAAEARYAGLMQDLGYDPSNESRAYETGDPAALGNYIADCVIAFGLQDGANEAGGYANQYYRPANPPLNPELPGNNQLLDPNRWQPLSFDLFIDQSGNPVPASTPEFVSPEWGDVVPFALASTDLTVYQRGGHAYRVYHDPGPPPMMTGDGSDPMSEAYRWNFSLVAIWSAHLDPSDGVYWDTSPAAIGNVASLPASIAEYPGFYDLMEGGDPGRGTRLNPVTGSPYWAQLVPRGDYARVLAEFWADGPDSETPPGHWFTILNYVSDHPQVSKRVGGIGPVVDDLEWDVKSYFALGGAMHDAAVTAWGVKGWYDYVRPVSAIRWMADQGQASDPAGPSYSPYGLPLVPGYIEMVNAGDPLAGESNEHVGKIKLYAWRGPDFIEDPAVDEARVGWILAENWWPYQRPTFITPPFAGYVSGHSTYSRAAAEIMTFLTGDAYFPGGMGIFDAPRNEFLVFEEGPSENIELQWATYRDASDQCSLSRIWGGIHPPADDIPGRRMGIEIGVDAWSLATTYFDGTVTDVEQEGVDTLPFAAAVHVFPNPSTASAGLQVEAPVGRTSVSVFDARGRRMTETLVTEGGRTGLSTNGWSAGVYFVRVETASGAITRPVTIAR